MARNEFGDLNPRSPREVREITNETSGIRYIRDAGINHNKVDILRCKTPEKLMATVLKVYDNPADTKLASAASGFNFWSVVGGDLDDTFVSIRARISPGYHHYLPEPSEIPLNPDSKYYHDDIKIVDMYPKFVSREPGLPTPRPGQVVWVSFEDKINFTGPLYLGIVDDEGLAMTIRSDPRTGSSTASPKDIVEGNTRPHTPPSASPPGQPPKPWTGELNGAGWFFPKDDIEYTVGAGKYQIETMAMVGGDPYIRALMRTLHKGEGTGKSVIGSGKDEGRRHSGYAKIFNGKIKKGAERAYKLNYKRGKKTVSSNMVTSYTNGHPKVAVHFRKSSSSAAGKYQFMGGLWDSDWAKYGRFRPGEPDRTREEYLKDFTPGNQDWCIYAYFTSHRVRNIHAKGKGGVTESTLELLKLMGNSPDPSNIKHLKIFKQVCKNKRVGKIWASMPYACYPNQSCYGLEGIKDKKTGKWDEGNNKKFKEKLDIYSRCLQEELQIAQQNSLLVARRAAAEPPTG